MDTSTAHPPLVCLPKSVICDVRLDAHALALYAHLVTTTSRYELPAIPCPTDEQLQAATARFGLPRHILAYSLLTLIQAGYVSQGAEARS